MMPLCCCVYLGLIRFVVADCELERNMALLSNIPILSYLVCPAKNTRVQFIQLAVVIKNCGRFGVSGQVLHPLNKFSNDFHQVTRTNFKKGL